MPVSLTTLTGPIYMPNGATPIGGRVSFELSSWDREEGEALIVSGPTYSNIDENGQFSVELFTTTEGVNTVNYRMYVLWEDSTLSQSYVNDVYVSSPVPHYTKKYIGSFALAGAGPFQVSDLNIVSELELNSFDVLLECQAYALASGVARNLAQAWAESPTLPDPDDPESMSSLTAAQVSVGAALAAQDAALAAQDAANAAARIPFATRAAAEGAMVPSAFTSLEYWHNGVLCKMVESDIPYALATNGGTRYWKPANPLNAYYEQWGLSPLRINENDLPFAPPVTIGTLMAGELSASAAINAIHAQHIGRLHLTGYLRIDHQITLNPRCMVVPVEGQRNVCGFAILSNFDMSVDHCIVCPPLGLGVTVLPFTIYQDQPYDAANRAALIRYPWALKFTDGARGTIKGLRVIGAINAVDVRDTASISNPGGITLSDCEIQAFGESLFIDGAFDFVKVENYRSWQFGISGFAALNAIFADGRTVGFRAEKVDGLVASEIMNHQTRCVLGRGELRELICTGDVGWLVRGETITQATSGATGELVDVIAGPRTIIRLRTVTGVFNTTNTLTGSTSGALGANSQPTLVRTRAAIPETDIPYVVGIAMMDAPKSYLEFRGGQSISTIYTSKDAAEIQSAILVTGGSHRVSNAIIRSDVGDSILVDGIGASLTISGGKLWSLDASTTFGRVKRGRLTVCNSIFKWPDVVSATPFITCEATGQMSITDCETDQMLTARTAVHFDADQIFNRCEGNRFDPHNVGFNPDWSSGHYESKTVKSVKLRTHAKLIANELTVTVPEYADNATASGAGLAVGRTYRTGDIMKVVH